MSERPNLDQLVREMAIAALEDRRATLKDLGLRARVEVKRRSSENSEIRIEFWREKHFVDVVEDFIVWDGRPVATEEEFKLWLEKVVDEILEENRTG